MKIYKYAKKVWKKFEIKNMGEYHDLYLETNVLLLSNVFENFRKICIENYDLDPMLVLYSTRIKLGCSANKHSKIELELLSDVDMLLFFENAIRGGVSMISNRYGKANNKYMKNYKKSKPTKYITYLDANNLYGWAMSKPLPINNFEWMSKKELKELDINKFETNQEIGYMLEVDLEYPHELHDLHNDYPLAPDKITVNKIEKLIPNLGNKTKYILHYVISTTWFNNSVIDDLVYNIYTSYKRDTGELNYINEKLRIQIIHYTYS